MTRSFRSSGLKYALPLLLAAVALAGPPAAAAPEAGPFTEESKLDKDQAGFYRLRIGKIDVTALSDGTGGFFVLNVLAKPKRAEAEELMAKSWVKQPVDTSINAFLIKLPDHTILVDTGTGDLLGPKLAKVPDSRACLRREARGRHRHPGHAHPSRSHRRSHDRRQDGLPERHRPREQERTRFLDEQGHLRELSRADQRFLPASGTDGRSLCDRRPCEDFRRCDRALSGNTYASGIRPHAGPHLLRSRRRRGKARLYGRHDPRPRRPVRRSGHHDRVRRRPEAGGGDEKEGVRRCSPERLLRRAGPHVLSGHRQAPGGGRRLPLASDPLRQRREEALTPQRHQDGSIRDLQDNALAVVENRSFDRFGVRAHRAALHLHPDRVRSAPDEAGLRARASRSKAARCAVAAPAPSRQAQLCGAAPAAVLFPGYGENEDQSGHDGSSSNEAERRG